jgi:protein disulfide-isomerase A6
MGVQGFPTLKIIRPGKKAGKPIVEEYQGARTAKAIADAVVDKVPNHVKKVTDKEVDGWLKESNETAKAVLFTDKGTTSALIRALAIDYLGSISFAQVRNKEKTTVETFGITKYPTFLVLPGGDKEAIVYDGELKKEAMSAFVTEATGTSPNPASSAAEPQKKKKPAAEKKKPAAEKKKPAAEEKKKDADKPADSEDGELNVPPPVRIDKGAPMILMLEKAQDLQKECFTTTSHICILCLLPSKQNDNDPLPHDATQALISLGEVQQKHSKRHSLFPFYSVPSDNFLGQVVREGLELGPHDQIEVIAVNAKRMWWRRFTGKGFMPKDIEDFVDIVRMNEGKRETLPDVLVKEAEPEPEAEAPKEEAPKKEKVPKPSSCPHGHDKKKKSKADKPSQAPPKGKVANKDGLEVEFLEDVTDEPAQAPEHNEL